jgi:hypothetical protein
MKVSGISPSFLKSLFATFLAICVASATKAQNGFQSKLAIAPGINTSTMTVSGLANGSILVSTVLHDGSTFNTAGYNLTQIDYSGTLVWSQTYSTSLQLNCGHPTELSDKSLVVAGAESPTTGGGIVVSKVDSLGNLAWSRKFRKSIFSLTNGFQSSIVETHSKKLLVAATLNDTNTSQDILMVQLDDSGNIMWAKRYGNPVLNENYPVISATSDGGSVFSCPSTMGSLSDYLVVKLDSMGTILWSKTHGRSEHDLPKSIKQTMDGGFVVAGMSSNAGNMQLNLMKLDSAGNFEWSKTYADITIFHQVNLEITSDNSIVVSTTLQLTPATPSIVLLKTNSNGTVVWSKAYSGYSASSDLDLVEDASIVMTGLASAPDTVVVVKTDMQGNSGCLEQLMPITATTATATSAAATILSEMVSTEFVPINITVTPAQPYYWRCASVMEVNEFMSTSEVARVYPNPFSDQLTIDLLSQSATPMHLQLTDVLGKSVYKKEIDDTTQNNFSIPTEGLAAGMYLLTLTDTSGTIVQRLKVVKQ